MATERLILTLAAFAVCRSSSSCVPQHCLNLSAATTTLVAPVNQEGFRLECKPPEGCLSPTDGCSFVVNFLRHDSCHMPSVPSRGRFLVDTTALQLSIGHLRADDTGIWECQVNAVTTTAAGATVITQIFRRIFAVHVGHAPSPSGVVARRGIHCDVSGQRQMCDAGQICYRQVIIASEMHPPLTGCVDAQRLPANLYAKMATDVRNGCHMARGTSECFGGGSPAGTNTICCFCFTDDCNDAGIDFEQLKWKTQLEGAACRELSSLRRNHAVGQSAARLVTTGYLATALFLTTYCLLWK